MSFQNISAILILESVWQFSLFSVVIISFYLTHSLLEMKQLDIIGLHKQWGAQNLFTILSFYLKDNVRYKNLHSQGIPVKSTLKNQCKYITLDINELTLFVFSDYWNNKGIDRYDARCFYNKSDNNRHKVYIKEYIE